MRNPGAWRDQTIAELKGLWRAKGMIEPGPKRDRDLGTGSAYFRIGAPNPLYNNSTGVRACMGISGKTDPRQNGDWAFHRRIFHQVPRDQAKSLEEPCCPSAR